MWEVGSQKITWKTNTLPLVLRFLRKSPSRHIRKSFTKVTIVVLLKLAALAVWGVLHRSVHLVRWWRRSVTWHSGRAGTRTCDHSPAARRRSTACAASWLTHPLPRPGPRSGRATLHLSHSLASNVVVVVCLGTENIMQCVLRIRKSRRHYSSHLSIV